MCFLANPLQPVMYGVTPSFGQRYNLVMRNAATHGLSEKGYQGGRFPVA
jgi:hypothetical protein